MCFLSAVEIPIISKSGLGSDDFLCCFSFADDELLLSELPTSSLLDNHTFMKGIFTLFLLPTLGGYGIKKNDTCNSIAKKPVTSSASDCFNCYMLHLAKLCFG